MHILNARLGFATNSSSSHSMIFVKEAKAREKIAAWNDGPTYAWEDFVLKSKEDKLDYLTTQLRLNLEKVLPDNIVDIIAESWTGKKPNADGGIDHQSVLEFPCSFGTKIVDEDFFKAYLKSVLRPEVIILGGNDNSDGHPLDGQYPKLDYDLPTDCRDASTVCRKEDDYWIVFDKDTGTKLRIAFDEKKDVKKLKPRTPELVDVKITDFCPFDCTFCYQGSTKAGLHAKDVSSFADIMGYMQVFEVAIGGGEPTLHPDFMYLLQELRKNGVVPNFTTRNKAIFQDSKKINEIFNLIGGVAFSTSDVGEIEELGRLLLKADIDETKKYYYGSMKHKVVIQSIIGPDLIDSQHRLECVMRACRDYGFALTLLGYKDTGRGEEHRRSYGNDYRGSWWIDTIKKAREKDGVYCNISIDTLLAEKFEKDLIEKGVDEILFTTKEGQFSCYVDLVKMQMGPSSYCDPKEMLAIEKVQNSGDELTYEEWQTLPYMRIFEKF